MSWITLVPDTIKFFKFKVIHLIRPQPEDKSLHQDTSHKVSHIFQIEQSKIVFIMELICICIVSKQGTELTSSLAKAEALYNLTQLLLCHSHFSYGLLHFGKTIMFLPL